ncbi:MAG: hypothetical protein QF921_13100 [Pseudomonadales bacterium]|mgnify:CR=1|nr:hypothetical protein [Pseudomonadales bacterium]MDP6469782.1 hypothetical protein [Pseudomonadales bacterium]MDP6827615.1 hypothetical protein [Pseudomonadales bacterium]MDP6972426.1 hypothetical protein [Pseudomonadales bacterium]
MDRAQLRDGFMLGDCWVWPRWEQIVAAGEPRHVEPRVMQVLVDTLGTHTTPSSPMCEIAYE